MDERSPRQDGVQSIDRAISILNCFSMEVEELSIGQIATETNLPKPTVYRLLSAMRKHQWIEQDERSGLYRLGFRLYTLGAIVGNHMDLRRSALPVMQKLVRSSKETVNLNIVEGNERICIELVEGSYGIRNFVKLGTRNSLFLGASGRVLLAHLTESQADALLEKGVIEMGVDRETLVRELAAVRHQGYAVTYSNRVQGACGISAPVFGHRGELIAGLTVSGPEDRIRETEQQIVKALVLGARELSERMGFVDSRSDGSDRQVGGR